MKPWIILGIASFALASCSTAAPEVEPVRNSITYGGHQPRTKLTKSPIGSTFQNRIIDDEGNRAIETYRIEPDRSLKLIRRQKLDIFPFDRDD